MNASFLHNSYRNYYGDSLPDKLQVIWKCYLGVGTTKVGKEVKKWGGAGWTGQPLMIEENGKKYLIQGAYDHRLKKIDAATGKIVWQYMFDDVLKGTGSVWLNTKAKTKEEACYILQGSRAGKSIYSGAVYSYRAVSFYSGKEAWRHNSTKTRSYSRDVDASALLVGDTAYIGLENGIFTVFNPNPAQAIQKDSFKIPQVYKDSDTLFLKSDIAGHGGNLVTESSPCRIGNHVYIASGSGHIWGYNTQTQKIDWSFFIGSDIDGSPIVTADSCLLISVEKQHIKGPGGVLKLNPRKQGKAAIVWYFPTPNWRFVTWKGGLIGSVSTNDAYPNDSLPSIAAFTAIDGSFYVINPMQLDTTGAEALLFDGVSKVPKPQLLFQYSTGPSISTPIIIKNRILAATYWGTYLFKFDAKGCFDVQARAENIRGESTPFVDQGRIFVASRDGNLYCLGDTSTIKK